MQNPYYVPSLACPALRLTPPEGRGVSKLSSSHTQTPCFPLEAKIIGSVLLLVLFVILGKAIYEWFSDKSQHSPDDASISKMDPAVVEESRGLRRDDLTVDDLQWMKRVVVPVK